MISLDKIKRKAEEEGVSANLVLKEKIHLLILEYLFKEGAFSDLVFQGGTAIRIVCKGVRYSEDLDFVLRKKNSPFFNRFSKALESLPSAMDKLLIFGKAIELKTQKETPTFKRYVLMVTVDGLGIKDRTNIEIANVPSYRNEVVIVSEPDIPVNPAVRAEMPLEILSDKLTAFGLREYVKGRDIWDIHFLLNTLRLSVNREAKQMVMKKIADYRSTPNIFSTGFRENLSKLKKNGLPLLKMEMEKFLPRSYRNIFKEKYGGISDSVLEVLSKFYKGMERG